MCDNSFMSWISKDLSGSIIYSVVIVVFGKTLFLLLDYLISNLNILSSRRLCSLFVQLFFFRRRLFLKVSPQIEVNFGRGYLCCIIGLMLISRRYACFAISSRGNFYKQWYLVCDLFQLKGFQPVCIFFFNFRIVDNVLNIRGGKYFYIVTW